MSTTYSAKKTLPFRIELIRQLRRRRTLVAYLLMIALPLIVVAAVKFGPSSSSDGNAASNNGFGSGSLNLIGLATSGAWNFTLVMILFGSGFLLTTVFALFCGDTVASEASWSTLRYLLAAPIPRRRILRVKLAVGMFLSLGALDTLLITSYLIGWAAFGNQALTSPLGGSFEGADALGRLLIIGGYVYITLLVTVGVAFLMSVVTDVPLGAVGTAVMIVIISGILDAIEALGSLREWLPSHYSRSWTDSLNSVINWAGMARGSAYALVVFAALVGIAFLKFDRKDITS